MDIFFPYSCQFFLQHHQQAEIGDQLVGKILSIVKYIISCLGKYINCSGKYSEDGSKKKKTRNVVLWCCFAGIRSWGQSSPKGRLLALATHLLGYCKQKVAKNLYPYYFFKRNHYIARFWTRAFPSSRCFHRISKRSSRATWRRLPTLNEPSCFASAWSREVPHPFSCVWLTALGELRPKFLGLSHLSFPLPCEMPNWYGP